ncbi:hypothetical protein KP79_PYT17612 [Mizuhopecten yessoensis]|uniref:Uncharacterized protein n=1 Tax=Mizuhopecten yessoensis TaxID=6573 RepID=A0A210Q531_MIZYE|nr:hypothetical protein KP79_PYT17612 [Mizuhopecten yessoensis]
MLWMRVASSSCPNGLGFTHQRLHRLGFDVFTSDTSLSCSQTTGISSVPVCYVESLNELMSQAENILRETANELAQRALFQTELCEIDPYDHSDFQNGISMADTLVNGIELLSEVALNMTIVNCHQHARFSRETQFNVHEPIRAVICEMKKLMRFARPVDPSKFRASISLREMDRTDITIFTCRNLRRAISAIAHLKHNINTDFENFQD